ncbi:MAG: succinylglutamate desuccinylase/aspartoacylase family protein, partial [Halobacteria archaeon]|nr:succinylglutamate desuccinylase/aspartoacylase family protein [Halobacteria archaeon]
MRELDGNTDAEPEVTVRGGSPEVVVVGGIHGDEPSGVRGIERVLESIDTGKLELKKGVKFVKANPPALEASKRYLDVDMNRVFPGDAESDKLEEQLAARICAETGDRTALALHSTKSHPEPFALVSRAQRNVLKVASKMPVKQVVDETGISKGSFTYCSPVVSIESGCQGTAAATDNAERMIEAFLKVTG